MNALIKYSIIQLIMEKQSSSDHNKQILIVGDVAIIFIHSQFLKKTMVKTGNFILPYKTPFYPVLPIVNR